MALCSNSSIINNNALTPSCDVIKNSSTTENTLTLVTTLYPFVTTSSDLISKATRDFVEEIVNCYILPSVFAFGVCGNVMSLVVLVVHGMNNSTNVLLASLTVSDFCFLVTMFVRKVSCIVSKYDYAMSRRIETGLIPSVYMVQRIFELTTPFLTMLITLERCIAVSLPFKVQRIVTPLRMKLTVSAIFAISAVAISPFFFIYTIQWSEHNATGKSVPSLSGTPFFLDNFDVITAYNNAVLAGLFIYGPMTIVVICTIIVFLTIQRSARWRKLSSKTGERREEKRTTKLLMTVVALYIVCYLPRCAALLANYISPEFNSLQGRYVNLFYLVSALQFVLFAFNSSLNFVIYMVMSKKFFNTYRRIFLCHKGIERQTLTMSSGNTTDLTRNWESTETKTPKPE